MERVLQLKLLEKPYEVLQLSCTIESDTTQKTKSREYEIFFGTLFLFSFIW